MPTDCSGCEHSTAQHFRDVDGVARCLWSDSGTSSSGIIGLPWTSTCDCVEFVSETGNYKREKRREEEEVSQRQIDRMVDFVKEQRELENA